ncbi:putative bifunctional diguanylate cyclase/phosphodiesterase [Undibacterium arcticum]|uniref:putative bifunctional diguanylate cyclase/phosphodiesterase n=1 Tax=Undibacterium arcticum TaxID=1762892 RepID=UPI00361DAD0D
MSRQNDVGFFQSMWTLVRQTGSWQGEVWNQRKNGESYPEQLSISVVRDDGGRISHYVGVFNDISTFKNYERQLRHLAQHDPLTQLPNRTLLQDRLSQAITYAIRYGHPVWVVFLDLDRFKFVNDSLGHKAGDQLLKTIAERLLLAVRDTDTVARLGGDEFVVVLSEHAGGSLCADILKRIMDAVASPLRLQEQQFFLTCSVGVAVYPDNGLNAETLIEHADLAMYRAKEVGRNNFQFYTPAMNAQVSERLRIESALRNALERDEFVLHYQPQVDLRTGRVVGMEALIRWRHPELGMVSPNRFISLAEETGLIIPIGAWVLRTACLQNKKWQRAGLGHFRIAVNLSARQFAQQDLTQSIADVLEETGLAPHYLDIELTESLIMTDVEHAVEILRSLKALGLQLSIDDFGTGYSSLSYLKRFPIDVLKIDRSFVHDITLDPDDAAIVVSIIALAHNLKLHVIAEGVETQEQFAYLKRHGCDELQGFYFSKPVPAEEFERLLREHKCLALEPEPA